MSESAAFRIGGQAVAPGHRARVELPVASLYTNVPVTLPVQVVRGRDSGPTIFVSAALHGDEINGVEVIRRVLKMSSLDQLKGTLMAVPIVNTLSFLHQSRYLPDRRDLNRNFPGSESGSLAARLANRFITEVVSQCQYGIDLHTGAINRPNLPQIRGNLAHADTERLAMAFGVPLLLNSEPTEGTLRHYTTRANIPVILYEAGEALRFDEVCIRIGVQGVMNVLCELGMLPDSERQLAARKPVVAKSSAWVRAPESGVLRTQVGLGDTVAAGQVLGLVGDPLGETEREVTSPEGGVVIGRLNLPLVHEGDALFHVARVGNPESVGAAVERMQRRSAEPVVGPSGEPPIA